MVWMPLCCLALVIVHCCCFYRFIDRNGKIGLEALCAAGCICGLQVACLSVAFYFSIKHYNEVHLAGAWSLYGGYGDSIDSFPS